MIRRNAVCMIRERSFTCREAKNSVIPEVVDTLRGDDPNASFVVLEDWKNVAVGKTIYRAKVIQTPIDYSIEPAIGRSNP
jgi:hypothetical protein